MSIKKLIHIIFKTVALGMGVATVVLSVMEKISAKDAGILLGLGVFCLAILNLEKTDEK